MIFVELLGSRGTFAPEVFFWLGVLGWLHRPFLAALYATLVCTINTVGNSNEIKLQKEILCLVDGGHQNWYWSEFTIWPAGQFTFTTRLSFQFTYLNQQNSGTKIIWFSQRLIHNFLSWVNSAQTKAEVQMFILRKVDWESSSWIGWKRLWLICSCAAQKWPGRRKVE